MVIKTKLWACANWFNVLLIEMFEGKKNPTMIQLLREAHAVPSLWHLPDCLAWNHWVFIDCKSAFYCFRDGHLVFFYHLEDILWQEKYHEKKINQNLSCRKKAFVLWTVVRFNNSLPSHPSQILVLDNVLCELLHVKI